MLFEAPASITDLLSSCKADFTPIIATMNDTPLTVNGICNDSVSDDSQHRIVGKLLKETSNGKYCEVKYGNFGRHLVLFFHREKMSKNFV